MKILCLQLARFGDIYQTWPSLNALRRKYPDAEIHFLVRDRFKSATVGLESIDRVVTLSTREILAPLVAKQPNASRALQKLDEFTASLRAEHYDRIVNLSFSPASSYLVDIVAHAHTLITGYTRHRDGFFCIPDDGSSYFYAQVGIERNNRIHLTDLFALIAGVELIDKDFQAPEFEKNKNLPDQYIVVHVGASQINKNCTSENWAMICVEMLKHYSGKIVFIGSEEENKNVPTNLEPGRIFNLVGKTQLSDLFEIIKCSELLIACDSMALHIASLVNKMTLNISFSSVRFWETGPRAKGSRILWFENSTNLEPIRVSKEAMLMLAHEPSSDLAIEKNETMGVIYSLKGYSEDDFCWELTQAMYMSHPFPQTSSKTIRAGFLKLSELAILGLENIKVIKDPKRQALSMGIIEEIDGLMSHVAHLVPDLAPVVRWFQAEKVRIGPGSLDEVIERTRTLFEKLRDVCQIYEINQTFSETFPRADLTWKP